MHNSISLRFFGPLANPLTAPGARRRVTAAAMALTCAGTLALSGCSDSQSQGTTTLPGKTADSPSPTASDAAQATSPKTLAGAQTVAPPTDKPADSLTTYANPKYGFLLDVPAGWQFGEETPDASQVSITGPNGEDGRVWGEDNSQKLPDGGTVCRAELAKSANKSFQVATKESDQRHCLLKLVDKTGKKGRLLSIYVGPAFLNSLQVDYVADNSASQRDTQALDDSFLPGGLTPR